MKAFRFMNRITLIIIHLMFVQAVFSQAYKIKVTIDNYSNDTLMLGYHYGEKQYLRDTAIRKNGEFIFQGKDELEPGMYLVVTRPDNDYFQMLVESGKQNFSIRTSADDLSGKLKYKDSKLNEEFIEYVDFVSSRRSEADSLQGKLRSETDSLKQAPIKQRLANLDTEVKNKQNLILKTRDKSVLSTLIRWSLDVDIPVFEGTTQMEKDEKAFLYYRTHYFDYVDFTDDRAVRLPLFHNKIDRYLTKLTAQVPDSINQALDYIFSKCPEKGELYKYLLSSSLNNYGNSKYVGMDGVYVHLAEKYYGAGKAPWVDAETLAKIVQDAKALKPLLIDKIAPDIKVFKQDGTPITLHSVNSPYTVFVIWAPDCSHCKHSMPELIKFYNVYKSKGVEIFALCNKVGKDEKSCWEGVESLHMDNWINTSDPTHSSNFRILYDVKSTPQVYILDENKKILTKKIAIEQLGDVMEKLFKFKANEKK